MKINKKIFLFLQIVITAVSTVIILCISQEILSNWPEFLDGNTNNSGKIHILKNKNNIYRLKHAYNEISQYFENIKGDKSDLGETEFFLNMPGERSNEAETQVYLDEVLSGLDIKKTCYNYLDDCKKINYHGLKYPSWLKASYDSQYRVYTNDGMLYYFDLYKNGIPKEADVSEILKAGGHMTKIFGFVQIDVNGDAPPNVWGKDLFGFNLAQDGRLYPFNGKDRAIYHSGLNWRKDKVYWRNKKILCGGKDMDKSLAVSGEGCAARLFENEWRYDYSFISFSDIFDGIKRLGIRMKYKLIKQFSK